MIKEFERTKRTLLDKKSQKEKENGVKMRIVWEIEEEKLHLADLERRAQHQLSNVRRVLN